MERKGLKVGEDIRYTNRESMSIRAYLDEIGKNPKYDPLSPEEERNVAEQARAGDKEAQDRLVKANLRFVISVAKHYEGITFSLDDLVQAGNEGLIRAIDEYDPTRGFKFISYAVWWIRQSIAQAINSESRLVRIPSNVYVDSVKLTAAERAFQQEEERVPTREELQERIGWKKERFVRAYEAFTKPASLDEWHGNERQSLGESMEDEMIEKPNEPLFREANRQQLDEALDRLSPFEQRVVRMYYGIDQDIPFDFSRIADELDVPKFRVTRANKSALKKLRNDPAWRQVEE